MLLFGKHINKYYLKYSWLLILGIIALLFVDWIQLYLPDFVGEIVKILEENSGHEQIPGIVGKILLVGGGMFVGRMAWRYTIFYASHGMAHGVRKDMFAKAERLSRDFYHKNKIGTVMAWFTNDLENVEEFFGFGTVMIVDAVFLSAFALVKMFMLDMVLAFFVLPPIALIIIWGALVERIMSKKWDERQNAFDKLYDFSQENFTGIRVIKAFVKENKEIFAFSKIARKNAKVNVSFGRLSVLFDVLIEIIIGLIVSLLFGFGGYFVWCVQNGTQPFGLNTTLTYYKLVTFYGYFDNIVWPMIALGQIVSMFARSKTSLKRISTFLDTPEDVKSPKDAIKLENVKGEIVFKNFNFSYPAAFKGSLKDINLTIKPGERIGIVGKVGSGKSTLANSILYFYNLAEDSVFIDGMDLTKCDIDSIRENISYVPQDNFLFSDTIENNILFAKANGTEEDAKNAAIFADVDSNIAEFKDGYKTVSGERGVTLSGGQKQRISIARAFVKNAPIMILDDSVSAVDTKTEETILNNIIKERKGKTTLIVASRVSTVHKLDKIIVMRKGEVEAFDTPKNLLKISPTYQKMVRLQELEKECMEGGNG